MVFSFGFVFGRGWLVGVGLGCFVVVVVVVLLAVVKKEGNKQGA